MVISNRNGETEASHLINKSEQARPHTENGDAHKDDADAEEPYYGLNDPRPKQRSLAHKMCLILCALVCLPILLVLFILYVLLVVWILTTIEIEDSQRKAGKIQSCEFIYKRPGKRLRVVPTPQSAPDVGDGTPPGASTDIVIGEDFLRMHEDGSPTLILDCEKGTWSLRKSIEYTVKKHLLDENSSQHAKDILNDNDRDKPRFLMHGWTTPLDTTTTTELWTTHARTPTWAAYYSWTDQLPQGKGTFDFNQSIDLGNEAVPDVFGYIYVLAVGNPGFYDDDDRIEKVSNPYYPNAPQHTPETEHRVFARYDYKRMQSIGDFPRTDPDAYIFVGRKVLDDANLKVVHRYRILKPGAAAGGC